MNSAASAKEIARLNDILRTTFMGGRVLMTRGIQALDERTRAEVMAAVQEFHAWTTANNIFDERDFGLVVVQTHHVFFKIDYYDLDMRGRSPNPAEPEVTTRVLTLMLAEEY